LEKHGLPDHQQNGKSGVGVTMALFDSLQGVAQEVKDKKEITDDEHGVDRQLNQESP
jgi:hypothetical protein